MQNWLWEMLVWTLFLKMFYLSQCCSFYMRKKEIGSRSHGLKLIMKSIGKMNSNYSSPPSFLLSLHPNQFPRTYCHLLTYVPKVTVIFHQTSSSQVGAICLPRHKNVQRHFWLQKLQNYKNVQRHFLLLHHGLHRTDPHSQELSGQKCQEY